MTLAKPFVNTAIIILLFEAIAISQYYSDVQKKELPLVPPTIIPEQAIKLVDLGLHSAAASAMWIYTIQNVTEHADKLPQLIENVTTIDPKFSYPYAFAALTIPSFLFPGFPDKAVEIAKKGILEADQDWRIPYYLATTYHIFFKDREEAALYFDIAARTPGAPDKIKTIAHFYGTAPSVREQTKQIWLSIYEESRDESVKETAKNYLVQIELLDSLDKAVLLYKQRYHKNPITIEDLVIGKIIKEVPVSPLGLEFYLKSGMVYVR